jgi:hypothetical protein
MREGKLYKLKKCPKNYWEINDNNYIVSMMVVGYLEEVTNHPILYLGSKKIGDSIIYEFFSTKLIIKFDIVDIFVCFLHIVYFSYKLYIFKT